MAKAYGLNNINTRLSASTEVWIQKQPQNVIFNIHPGLALLRKKAKMHRVEKASTPTWNM